MISIGRDNQTIEVFRRMRPAAFGIFSVGYVWCVLPVLIYGVEVLSMTKRTVPKIRVAQMETGLAMFGGSLQDKISNLRIWRRSGMFDVVERINSKAETVLGSPRL